MNWICSMPGLRNRSSVGNCVMNAEDFRQIALKLPGAEEGSHMGAADFRVGGRIFATLASQDQGYGNLMLTAGAAGGVRRGSS